MAQVPSKFKLLESAQFTALCGRIGRTQATLTADIQTAAINAVAHSLLHGNVQCAMVLYNVMGKSLRKDSLVAWLEKYGAVAWSKNEKKFLYFKRDDVKFTEEYAEQLAGDPWNTAVRQPDTTSKYDIDAMFDKFLARCRKIAEDAKSDKSIKVSNADLLDALSSASASWFDAKAKKESAAPKRTTTGEKRAASNRAIKADVEAQGRADKFHERVVEPTMHLQQPK
jgi:hypothetical protein